MMDYLLRIGKSNDWPQASRLIYETDKAAAQFIYGMSSTEINGLISRLWRSNVGCFSHKLAEVAELEGQVVGVRIGYGTDHFSEIINATLGAVPIEECVHLAKRFERVSSIWPRLPDDAYYLQTLAVASTERGKGIGSKLLNRAFQYAREVGYTSCVVDAVQGNPSVSFYKSMGMIKLAEYRDDSLLIFNIRPRIRLAKRL